MYYDSISMKLQKRQNSSCPGKGGGCELFERTFWGGGLFCNLTVGVVMELLMKLIKMDT